MSSGPQSLSVSCQIHTQILTESQSQNQRESIDALVRLLPTPRRGSEKEGPYSVGHTLQPTDRHDLMTGLTAHNCQRFWGLGFRDDLLTGLTAHNCQPSPGHTFCALIFAHHLAGACCSTPHASTIARASHTHERESTTRIMYFTCVTRVRRPKKMKPTGS